jgi:hypothetical protein
VERARLAQGTVNPIFFCPSRREPMSIPYYDGNPHAMCDYALSNSDQDGIGRSQIKGPNLVRIEDVTDGLSNTIMVSEKRMNLMLLGQLTLDDDNGYTYGYDLGDTGMDTVRSSRVPPQPDFKDPSITALGTPHFGSSHPGIFIVAVADGSVRPLTFDIKPAFFNALATIRGGEVVPEDDFQ